MKRVILILLAALPLLAQDAPVSDAKKPVATVNGETITVEKLDHMYSRLSSEMRANYDKNGGRAALLENYIRKRLLVQEAIKKGFDRRADVQADLEAARESALFDRYVRESVSSSIVTDAVMQKYYEENLKDFAVPEAIKARHIVIAVTDRGPNPHTDGQALEIAKQVLGELREQIANLRSPDPIANIQAAASRFAMTAIKYSEDGVGPSGGLLGWVERGRIDPDLEPGAFALKPGVPSGILKSKHGYHIFFVDEKRAAGTMSFEEAKPRVREILVNQYAADILNAVSRLTNELTNTSKISVYPENIK